MPRSAAGRWVVSLLAILGLAAALSAALSSVLISRAVEQFSAALATDGDVDELKQELGKVTDGIGFAFDIGKLTGLLLATIIILAWLKPWRDATRQESTDGMDR